MLHSRSTRSIDDAGFPSEERIESVRWCVCMLSGSTLKHDAFRRTRTQCECVREDSSGALNYATRRAAAAKEKRDVYSENSRVVYSANC